MGQSASHHKQGNEGDVNNENAQSINTSAAGTRAGVDAGPSLSSGKGKQKAREKEDAVTADSPASMYMTIDGGFLIPVGLNCKSLCFS